MATHYRTYGFVIKKTDRGEADQSFTIYTKDYGKLKVLGKAIRKTKSKLRAGIDLFYLSEIEFIQGKTHKTLTDTVLIENFSDIGKDLGKLKVAYQIAKITDSLISGEEKDERIWQLLEEAMKKLSLSGGEIIYYYFFWNLISLLGYHPELRKDSLGGETIDTDTAKILKIIFRKDWPTLLKLRLEPQHYKSLQKISEYYRIKIYDQK